MAAYHRTEFGFEAVCVARDLPRVEPEPGNFIGIKCELEYLTICTQPKIEVGANKQACVKFSEFAKHLDTEDGSLLPHG